MANDDRLRQVDTQYGQFFADLLSSAAQRLHNRLIKVGTPRRKRSGIDLGFRENDMRAEVGSLYKAAVGGPALLVEQRLLKDVRVRGESLGGADYVLVEPGSRVPPPLTSVLATCEVKGPTRAAFLDPARFGNNWAQRGLVDVEKQLARAQAAPAAEHHVAFLIPFNQSHVVGRIRMAFVKQAMLSLTSATLKRSGIATVELANLRHPHLTVIVFRVSRKESKSLVAHASDSIYAARSRWLPVQARGLGGSTGRQHNNDVGATHGLETAASSRPVYR